MLNLLLRILLAAAAFVPCAQARLVEDVVQVPVTLKTLYGKTVQHNMLLTLFHDDSLRPPYPVAVIAHGRDGSPAGRAALARVRYVANARWLAQMGFLVAVPTRVGYGQTDGEDVEYGGPCNNRVYAPGLAAAADQIAAAIDVARQRPDAARDRAVVLGQSFGGAASIALAARNPPGVQAVLAFAAGGGANPVDSAQQPCASAAMQRTFAGYGAKARVPTLWLYAENDMYFGPRFAREWFDAFEAAGGRGEFVLLPPQGDDGHTMFGSAPQAWRPRVLQFLRANGYPALKDPP